MLILFLLFAHLEQASAEGKAFGITKNKGGFKAGDCVYGHGILDGPTDDSPSTKVNKDARFMMDATVSNKSDGLEGDRQVEHMLERGDETVNKPDGLLKVGMHTHTPRDHIYDCMESTVVPQAVFHRTLKLDVYHQDQKIMKVCRKQTKRCTGEYKHPDNHHDCHLFVLLPSSEEYLIERHQDCAKILGWPHFTEYEKEVQKELTELRGESWEREDPQGIFAKVQNNEANIIKSTCVEAAATRYYHGKPFHRKCWRQRVAVSCPGESVNTCVGLRKKGCILMGGRHAPEGVIKRYRCPTRKEETIMGGQGGIHAIDGGALVSKPTEYDDMVSSMAQLAAVSEMQKDLKALNDPKNVRVFKGECLKCMKNIWDSVLYDCCGTLDGFALNLGFTQCNAEERKLAQIRSEKRCHYVGHYANEFVAWKSSDTHVYCCYPSQLIAVLQGEARKQLGKDFGTSQKPDCDGLSIEDIMRLDFSRMDLSPLFDALLKKANTNQPNLDLTQAKEKMEGKVQALQKRLRS